MSRAPTRPKAACATATIPEFALRCGIARSTARDLIARAGVPAIRFHDLHHTSATLLLAEGEHGKIGQERLGHSNIAMTRDLNSHVTADMQRQAADALEATITGAEQKSA
jgi:integrase